MDKITKQAIIWILIIVFGGGIVSALLGQGFWGEKRDEPRIGEPRQGGQAWPNNWGSSGPDQSAKCDPAKPCGKCHPDK